MIKTFGTMYIGGIDLDNMGYRGTRANDRSYSDAELATVFDKAEAVAKLLDHEGYESLWLAEHHFQPEGYEGVPNLLLEALHLCHVTERLKIGCGFNILPMWHPLRLAEDYAMVDHLTRGRVMFGIGRGYHTREVETFGAPMIDAAANRELFDEQVEVLFKAFNQRSFSHRGKHFTIPPSVPYRGYQLENITLVPRPRTLPVECWQPIVSGTAKALDLMVHYGIKGMIGGGAGVTPGGMMDKLIIAWREALLRSGREALLGEDLRVGLSFYVCDSVEKGMADVRPLFEEAQKFVMPLGFMPFPQEQIDAVSDPAKAPSGGLPTLEEAVKAGSWIIGPPELIIERLMGFESRYPGIEAINVNTSNMAPLAMMLEQLSRFAREVMPAFNGRQA